MDSLFRTEERCLSLAPKGFLRTGLREEGFAWAVAAQATQKVSISRNMRPWFLFGHFPCWLSDTNSSVQCDPDNAFQNFFFVIFLTEANV